MKTKHHTYEFTDRQKEIINGCLLGDGTLIRPKRSGWDSNFTETHSTSQASLLEWIQKAMKPFPSNLRDTKARKVNFGRENYNVGLKGFDYKKELYINACPYFTELEKKWYQRDSNDNYVFKQVGSRLWRIKVVPKDLIMTPTTMRLWFWGDGYTNIKERKAGFCTQSFTNDEQDFLIEKLKSIDIFTYRYYDKTRSIYTLKTHAKSFMPLIEMLKQELPKSMEYKVDLSNYTSPKPTILNEELVIKIKQQLQNKESPAKIARDLSIAHYLVRNIKDNRAWNHIKI